MPEDAQSDRWVCICNFNQTIKVILGHIQVQRPTGICVLPSGDTAVADYDNKWVSVFEAGTGKFLRRLGHGKLLGPKGVAVCPVSGRLVVVDNRASAVLVFQPASGKLLHKFGSRGADADKLAGPHYVAVNSKGDIVVSDFHNHAIKVNLSNASIKSSSNRIPLFRCSTPRALSASPSAPTARATGSSTRPPAWPSTRRTTSWSPTGETRGYR